VQSKESYDENGWVGRSWLGVLALMLLLGKLTASQALPVILIAMVFLALTGAAFMKNMGHFRLSSHPPEFESAYLLCLCSLSHPCATVLMVVKCAQVDAV
jgi:hypothetical protein